MFKLVLEKAEEPEIKLPTYDGSSRKQEFKKKNICFCFIDYAKAFDSVDHNKLWKILKEMGIPEHLTCLLRKMYAGQEATVRTGHRTKAWFQLGKGIYHGCILSPCLFNLYEETPGVTGKFGLGVHNEGRQRLTEFFQENALVIANSLFQEYKRRLHVDITRWPIPKSG